jgi:hypothetical protein
LWSKQFCKLLHMSAVNMVVTSGLTTKTVLISKFVDKFSMDTLARISDPR